MQLQAVPSKIQRMPYHLKKLCALSAYCLFAWMLSSCGSPIYRTHYSYHAPADDHGRVCILQAKSVRNACMRQCDAQYTQCKITAADHAKQIFPQTYKAWETEHELRALSQFHSSLKQHHRQPLTFHTRLSLCNSDTPNQAACAALEVLGDQPSLNTTLHLIQTQAPTLSGLTQELSGQCTRTCACEAQYRQDYRACGGHITQTRTCVGHCSN